MTVSETGRTAAHSATPFGKLASGILGTKPDRDVKKHWNRGDSPRTREPVWRNSYTVGQIEDRVFKPINGGKKRDAARWIGSMRKAARRFEQKTRLARQESEPGARNGALGPIGIEVLNYLYETVDYQTGRLEPAVRTIADEIGHAYSAVHEALCRLRKHGFLRWMRRSKPVDHPEPGGPQIQQFSNAYALLVPESLQSWIKSLFGRPRVPECEQERRTREKSQFEAMLAALPAVEMLRDRFGKEAHFGDVLSRIAAAVDRREALTANPAEPMKPGDYK